MGSSYDECNSIFWDEMAAVHSSQSDYDLENYRPDTHKINKLDKEVLGSIKGKRILHLQCHVGLDTLALEQLGAHLVGVDYSIVAINCANRIKNKFGLTTSFYCKNVCEISELNLGEFDIIYTSYGVLVWLENLNLWASQIYNSLKKGGRFILIDEHPHSMLFKNPHADNHFFNGSITQSYFREDPKVISNYKKSYASDQELQNQNQHIWLHTLESIFFCLFLQNLQIIKFQEFGKSFYQVFSNMHKTDDGWWAVDDQANIIPLTFLIEAKKV